MNTITNANILEACIDAFHKARGSVVNAMPLLYEIWEKELWSAKYSNLSEFLDECGISRSQASRLITVYARFKDVPEMETIDAEKLYLASRLGGNPEEQFEKARALSRSELKSQIAYEDNGTEHIHEAVQICRICSVRM